MRFISRRRAAASSALALFLAGSGALHAYSFDEIGRGNISLENVGPARFVMADVDADGRDDLVFAATAVNPTLVVYGRLADGTRGFKQLTPMPWQGTISRVLAWTRDGAPHVIVLQDTGIAHDFAGWPLAEVRSFPVAPDAERAAIGDVDADGTDDLVVLTDEAVLTYAMSDGHAESTIPVAFGNGYSSDIALAQLDADPALEIILAGSVYGSGLVLDGATGAIDWQYDTGFGNHVAAGHLDGGSTMQWIGDAWQVINVFGGGPYGLLWSAPTPEDVGATATADLDGNGHDSILVGDGQWGDLHVFDAATHHERFAIPHDADGVRTTTAGDLDGDGIPEIAFAGSSPHLGETLFTIADSRSGDITEKYIPGNGPMAVAAIGDIDGDGRQELVTAAFTYESFATIAIFDLETGAEKWRSVAYIGSGNDPFYIAPAAIRLVPHADGHGEDIVLAGLATYDGRIEVIDGNTMQEVFSVYGYGVGPLASRQVHDLALHDVDGDGVDDFIVITDATTTGANGVEVLAFSGADGSQLWTTDVIGDSDSRARRVILMPSTTGGVEAVAVAGNRLYAFDAATGTPTWTLAATADGAAYLSHGVAGAELAVYSAAGAITFYDATTHAYLRAFSRPAPICDVLTVDGNVSHLVVAAGDALEVFDGAIGVDHATAGQLGQCIANGTRLAAQNEGTSRYAIAVGTDSALFRERLILDEQIFSSSFEMP